MLESYKMQQSSGKLHSSSAVANPFSDIDPVSSSLYTIIEEIFGKNPSSQTFDAVDKAWNAVRHLLTSSVSDADLSILLQQNFTSAPLHERFTLLSALLCHVVSEDCELRKTYISNILNLPKPVQNSLMNIIKDHHEKRRLLCPRSISSSRSVESSPQIINKSIRSNNQSTPQYSRCKRLSLSPAFLSPSADSIFSPPTRDSALEALVDEYRRKNTALLKELESCQASEAECMQKLHSMQQTHRKEMIKLETSLLDRETQMRETYEVDLNQMQQCLLDCQRRLEEHERSAKEMDMARDQLDLFQHTQDRLTEAEEKLRKYRERSEQVADLQAALKREQEAHNVAVDQCLRLEQQLQELHPLSRQLEEYKAKWTQAQVDLARLQADLQKYQAESHLLSQKELQMNRSVQAYQEQSDKLLQQLKTSVSDEGFELSSTGSVIGDGIR
jgi:hypothetical protein